VDCPLSFTPLKDGPPEKSVRVKTTTMMRILRVLLLRSGARSRYALLVLDVRKYVYANREANSIEKRTLSLSLLSLMLLRPRNMERWRRRAIARSLTRTLPTTKQTTVSLLMLLMSLRLRKIPKWLRRTLASSLTQKIPTMIEGSMRDVVSVSLRYANLVVDARCVY
jgi:hypothetical protein